jgi:hypothetical protein
VEKLGWACVILLCKNFIPSYAFDALLCRNWRVRAPESQDFTDNSIGISLLLGANKNQNKTIM